MEDNLNSKENLGMNTLILQQDSKQNNESISLKKEEENSESKNENENENAAPIDINNSATKENGNSNSNNDKGKRHRRGKKDTTEERTYKCPDCDKCYLSNPALITHRKTKHQFNNETEKKSRGRPKKEEVQEASFHMAQNHYNNFLNDPKRKKKSENDDTEIINLDVVKDNMRKIFRHCRNEQQQLKDKLFNNLEDIENYPFYQLIINNWDNENHDFPNECLSDNNKNESSNSQSKFNSPPLDPIFFFYLKEFASKTNKDYFWFINKFIVLFREFINTFKKKQFQDENKTMEKDKEFSQLFSAEGIPESCNDFFLEFLQPNNYYGLDEKELIELAQHFCFWLYTNKYTHSYLTLL